MSTGSSKRDLETAHRDAEAFRDLFAGLFIRWEIAGSVRRGRPLVGDIEHVVMGGAVFQRMNDMLPAEGLFGHDGILTKAVYSDGSHRWGEKYRGVMFRGFRHEVFMADELNWGAILAIRTGPAEFSQRMMTDLKRDGYLRQDGGYVRAHGGSIVPARTEQDYLRLCGCRWLEPHERDPQPQEAMR